MGRRAYASRHADKTSFSKRKPLEGKTIGGALHVTKETAVLVETLQMGGAEIALTASNPLSTQNDVAAALAKADIHVYAWRGETKEEYYQNINRVLDYEPVITFDDGADLVSTLHDERKNKSITSLEGRRKQLRESSGYRR